MAEVHLQQNVLDGGLFVFINRRRDRAKLLYGDGDGLCIWYQRLERGTVERPAVPDETTHVTLTAIELAMLLGGIELASAKRRPRYQRSARWEPRAKCVTINREILSQAGRFSTNNWCRGAVLRMT